MAQAAPAAPRALETQRLPLISDEIVIDPAPIGAADDPSAQRRRFSGLVYSGAVVETWFGALIIELKSLRLPQRNTPILFNHSERLGVAERYELTEDGVRIEGYLLAGNPRAAEVARDADQGYPWEMSVGVDFEAEELPDGERAEVNGQTVQGPIFIARGARLRESSVVTLGADADTSAALLRRDQSKGARAMLGRKRHVKAQMVDMDDLTAEEIADNRPDLLEEIARMAAEKAAEKVDDGDDAGQAVDEAVEETVEEEKDGGDGETSASAASASRNGQAAKSAALTATEARAIAKGHPGLALEALEHGWSRDMLERVVLERESRSARSPLKQGDGKGASGRSIDAALESECVGDNPERDWRRSATLRAAWKPYCADDEEKARKAFLVYARGKLRSGDSYLTGYDDPDD